MNTQNYQQNINTLLTKDETGLVSSFALQLDSILSENNLSTDTEHKLMGETINFLHDLLDSGYLLEDTSNF